MEDKKETDSFPSQDGVHQEKMAETIDHLPGDPQQPISSTLRPIQPIQEGIEGTGGPKKGQPFPFSATFLKLLSECASCSNEAREGTVSNIRKQSRVDDPKLSTVEIMRVAGRVGNFSLYMHPYGSAFSVLSMEEEEDVELAQLLLSAAENVGCLQFDRASRLITRCERLASGTGNPVQRIVYYFAEAIRERIDRETGRITTKTVEERGRRGKCLILDASPAYLAAYQEIPLVQAFVFAGMQAIIENVVSATKIHLIDLQIRSGIQWAILMQALAERDECPIKLLKLTAIGTTNKQDIEGTCKRLLSFAESLNLPFSFKVVFLSDMKDVKADELIDFDEADETVAVYSPTILSSMITRPDCLDSLMRAIQRVKPAIMVVNEIEADHNSPSFVKRFLEALLHNSAWFDCFEACMERDNKYRMALEGTYFRDGIRNMIATDGEEMVNRSVKIDVWREFFARFGMVEVELSESSLYQAHSIVKQFACGSSCTLDKNGKSLIVGWKGTPLQSLSTWKFS